ncbi:MAG: ATP-binding cassette domain-containing protein [Chitinophagaceae bacterium]
MRLAISKLLPTYFERSRTETSEIWGKDLVWQKGEMIKIVAPSGSGKSSLVNFLYGMRKDYEGSILYDQHQVDTTDAESMAVLRKDHLSIVFQDLRLFPNQTVQDNLELKRQLNPYHPKEKIAEMAERLGIGKKLSSLAKTCSYGEQQRVAIIRALMQPFDFLLLDEPFSHLDNRNAELAMQLMLEEAGARQASIIFADLERIEFFPFTSLYHL